MLRHRDVNKQTSKRAAIITDGEERQQSQHFVIFGLQSRCVDRDVCADLGKSFDVLMRDVLDFEGVRGQPEFFRTA